MDNQTIDNIVWWIPVKRLRNLVRESLISIRNIELLYDKINDILDYIYKVDIILCQSPSTPFYNRNQIVKYGIENDCKICVETGTFLGDTAYLCSNYFDKFYTIELDDNLYKNAVKRFENNNKVICLKGDSGIVLKDLLKDIKEKTLFWLDGHYSDGITARGEKDTPIMEELSDILDHPIKNHVILIDDARCFGEGDYPEINKIEEFIRQYRPNCDFKVKNDIIRIIL